MAKSRTSAGFWSYVRLDDEHENGRISRLRERLESSIRFYSGHRDYRIFQDRKDIGWGEKWSNRLTTSLDDAMLLFSVVTPSYFSSRPCREEILTFADQQEKLNRTDLILPIYYLTTEKLDRTTRLDLAPEEQKVADLLHAHQHEDWRPLRQATETDPAYVRAIERLAEKAAEALRRSASADVADSSPPDGPAAASRQGETDPTSATNNIEAPQNALPPSVETAGHIVTLTVNPMPGRAQFVTISDAIARAPGGARILISPGHYRESLEIEKPLELIGDGPREDIIIESIDSDALTFDTNIGVVRNLTLRQSQAGSKHFCVSIKQGRLELEDCDLSSKGMACLAVANGADPRVRRNRIHDGEKSGISMSSGARGTYEDNEIFRNSLAGIIVRDGSDPVVRRNRIHDGRASGIFVFERGRGVFEDNEISKNRLAGMEVKQEADPTVRRNQFLDGNQAGLYIHSEARGIYEDNQIRGNNYAGVEVKSEAEPTFRRNQIRGNRQAGVYVHNRGLGVFEDNDIIENSTYGILVEDNGEPTVRRNRITGGSEAAVRVAKGGAGTFEDNDLTQGSGQRWYLDAAAKSAVKRARNLEP